MMRRRPNSGQFDVQRGWFVHVGRVGIYFGHHADGPARRKVTARR